MPRQLIYTSWPRGLAPGQSGFCTVARSSEMRDALVQRLEQLSSYHHLSFGGNAPVANPLICAYRILDIRGAKYHLLTRIQDAGLDFTGRTNHLTHHLVFEAFEVAALPSPAAIFRFWNGWRTAWKEEPRLLGDADWGNLNQVPPPRLPATGWQQFAGDAGRAAGLLESDCVGGCYLLGQPGGEARLLELFSESLQLLDPEGRTPIKTWPYPFTTFLQGEDNPADFRWRGCWAGTPGYQAAARSGAAVLDPRHIRIPENESARFARQGKALPPAPTVRLPDRLRLERKPKDDEPAAVRSPLKWKKPPQAERELSNKEWESSTDPREQGERSEFWRWVMILTLLVVALGGFGGFVWPGWLTKKSRPLNGLAADPATPVVTTAASPTNPTPPAPTQSPDSASSPATTPPPEKEPSQVLAVSPEALSQLEFCLDGIPSYVLILSGSEVSLPPIPKLEKMLSCLVDAPNAAELILQTNKMNLFKAEGGGAVTFSCEPQRKILSCNNAFWGVFQISFSDWYMAKNSAPNVRKEAKPEHPIKLKAELSTVKSASVLFRPVPNAEQFAPFRLVVVKPDPQSKLVELSKSLLEADKTDFQNSLGAELAKRMADLQSLTPCEFQLRVFTVEGTNSRSLYAMWREGDRPLNNGENELNFVAIRPRLRAAKDTCERELQQLTNSISNLAQEIASLEAATAELKATITRLNEEIDETKKSIQGTKGKIEDHNKQIEKLVKDVEAENRSKEKKELKDTLANRKTMREAKVKRYEELERHENSLAVQTQGHETDKKQKEDELEKKKKSLKEGKNKESAKENSLKRLSLQLAELPANIFSNPTTQVRLVIVDPKSKSPPVELIRFTNSPK